MNTSATYRHRLGHRSFPQVLEVPMLFDEEIARELGGKLGNRITTLLAPRNVIHLLPWKLTVTRYPNLAEIVAREALRAPFLLVTINGANTVTPETEALVRRCAAALSRGAGALVTQLYGISKDERESSPAYRCLKQIAAEANIPIFSTVVEPNHPSRGAGRPSPRRDESPHVAFLPQTLQLAS